MSVFSRKDRVPSFSLRNLSLLAKFGLISFVLIVLFGFGLEWSLNGLVRQRAMADARERAGLMVDLTFRDVVTRADARTGRISPAQRAELGRAISKSDLERVALYDREGRVLYSDTSRLIGRRTRLSGGLKAALDGQDSSELVEERGGESERLDVYVPFRPRGGKAPAGALELSLPYGPIASGISSDSRRLLAILLGGLVLLWVGLGRIVARASSQLRQQATVNQHQAQHDALTGLPNRPLFHDLVKRALAGRKGKGSSTAVMIMDLDRFKEINDTLGHFNGDLLLQRVGPRIRNALRDNDTVARLGGDEYAVLLPEMPDRAAVTHAAQRILAELRQPVVAGGLALEIEASIGIALFPEHGDRVEILLQRADVAMYTAKRAHSGFEFYSPEQHEYSPARLALVGELRRAIDQDELVLHYQPKADLQTGRVTGVEALVRWEHPRRGLLSPDEFVPLAEHTRLITPLTLHVLETAIAQCRAWQKQGHELTVAVNLSVRNLVDRQLPSNVAALLDRHSVSPSSLELEITESMIMSEPRRAATVLRELSEMGISLSIDDFGTGYSSLAYLKELPVRALKIDKSFVMEMVENASDAMIVESTVDLGHNLGLRVVAEGVESLEAWRRLGAMGCDTGQGYFLSRPQPAAHLSEWLLSREPAAELAQQARVQPSQDTPRLRSVGGLNR